VRSGSRNREEETSESATIYNKLTSVPARTRERRAKEEESDETVMPAEIDTGGHRVLHCDSHADCPTATSIHVSTSPNDECRTDRAHLSERIDDNRSNASQKSAPKDRRKTRSRVRKAEPLNCKRENPPSNHGESSPTRVPRIGDEEETILGGRDFLTKSRVLRAASLHRRRGERGGRGDENENGNGLFEACCVSKEFSRVIEDVTKDERFSVTWNSREGNGDEIERAESRLRDETERYRLAIADGSSIAKRRSLRDRSCTRSRSSSHENKTLDTDPTDRPGRTRTAGESPLLSSHHSRIRAKDETYEDDFKDVDERFFCEDFDNDTWTAENGRLDCSERRDERPEDERNKKLGQDFADKKRIRYRVYSFLQLAFLLFLVVFGRYGLPLDSFSVRRVSARPIANGLSVLGIGVIGAVNAKSIDLIGDAGTRAERSANLSHITGVSRKIQMFIKNRHLQILPDGTVNGSNDANSDYSEYASLCYRSMIS